MSWKFNPFTGNLDISGSGSSTPQPPNFSYKLVDTGETIEIPLNQQMLVDGHTRVLGHLLVNGELRDISNRQPEKFFYYLIQPSEVVEIYTDRLLLYKRHLTVQGHIRVNGRLEEC